ncbi:transporter substrate-binding domain-containing protein [Simiduia sp. 21SJ11W-1]|uniref:substrate-binding periplasmic protein n=1 Tax=Simiduia sp. 21SJ11W-1 TaxID=2909669 RepID=UPI00209EE3D4|nr:transporter substrate-binding domain-containing protein [Simiduia sp. 21SJ11W-1]UTA47192.1 transporter substrate-binding domain-containing protein [Simiduia sp. 21SJ11W-1]
MNELEYITENYPPFNYEEQGVLKGEAVELLIAATALAGSPITARDILMQPWARAFHNVLEGPNRVLFSTTRTPERENLFKWAGPIGSNHIVLVGKKSRNITLNDLADLNKYRVGAVRDDVGELFLRDLQLEKTIITLGVQPESIAKMLQSNRVDLWIYGESSAFNVLKRTGATPSDYTVVKVLKSLELYYAFSRDVDDRLVQELQAAIETIKGAQQTPTQAKSVQSQLYRQPEQH